MNVGWRNYVYDGVDVCVCVVIDGEMCGEFEW